MGHITILLRYDNCDMKNNGKLKVIRHMIHDEDIAFDLGANIGDWSDHLLNCHNKKITIYAFEPVPDVYIKLITRIESPQFFAFQLGVSNCDGQKNFYHYDKSDMSAIYQREPLPGLNPPEIITISVTTLDTFVLRNNIPHINL